MKDYGLLQVYTGDGKGKTTAALGVALRACAKGAKVVMLSFFKDDPTYGEAMGAKFLPGFTLKQVGRDAFVNLRNPDKIDVDMARNGWELAKQEILGDADIVILDEINIVLAYNVLPVDEVIEFLDENKGKAEVICTGRQAPEALLEIADLVTEMQEVKHYFHLGIESREGIDH